MATAPSTGPARHLQRLTSAFDRFIHLQAAGGLVLLAATLIALGVANSPWAASWAAFWDQPLALRLGTAGLEYPLWYWINDGLMAIFFFVIGLEIKRELVWGELRDRRNVVLPALAALGGVMAPVAIYLTLMGDGPGRDGWAIPMATDIAFVVGCLAIMGRRVPPALKVFVVSLAIIDDIVAVLVIAVFFSSAIEIVWIASASAGLGLVVVLQRAEVRRVGIYLLVGAGVWFCALKSGVHPTVAGVLLGLMTPARAWFDGARLRAVAEDALDRMREVDGGSDHTHRQAADDLAFAATESVSPLERLEHALHPWSVFVIMPIFALANAGVEVSLDGLGSGVAVAVIAGLALGKPLGITLAALLATRLGWARLPAGVSWSMVVGAGCLAGIGFTMALFIGSLSLDGTALAAAKTGILAASALSMVIGMSILAVRLRAANLV